MIADYNGVQLLSHGYGGYTRGCKCDTCRAAKAAYVRERRAAAKRQADAHTDGLGYHFVPDIEHGRFGYEEKGCRCPRCVAAKRAEWRRRVAVRRAAAS